MEKEKVKPIEIINNDGTLNKKAGFLNGLKVKKARKRIINELKKSGRVEKIEPINHVVNTHERCGEDIEILMIEQWFIKYLDLKKKMLQWGERLRWYPEYMKVRYENWVKGLKWDWNISRQRFYGVPIPVWYCKKCGEIILPEESQLPVDPLKDKPKKKCRCGSGEFIGEKDVLDTWATSSLTPRLAIELMPKKTWKKLYPMNLRPQAHDIITFWLFNTVVKGNLHYKKNPFKDVMISGFVLDPKGKKMSKSKGNVIAPQEVFKIYGADALRYWAASSKLGEDLPYKEKDLITGKKFITKILNASRFVFMNLKKKAKKPKKLEKIDKFFLNKLSIMIKDATNYFENYEYSKVKFDADNFFWKDFCDNYLEIIKRRIYSGNKQEKKSAEYTLYTSLLAILKMFAPITPFITEEIYQKHFKKYEKYKSIHISNWPEMEIRKNEKLEKAGNLFIQVLEKVRKKKAEKKKSVKAEIILTLDKKVQDKLKGMLDDLKAVVNAKEIKEGKFKIEFVG